MSSDGVVTSRVVVQSIHEVNRRGVTQSLRQLEQTEPEFAEHVLEELTMIHRDLLALGGPPRKSQRLYLRLQALLLVTVECLRRGHYQLWEGSVEDTPPTRLSDNPVRPAADPNPADQTDDADQT